MPEIGQEEISKAVTPAKPSGFFANVAAVIPAVLVVEGVVAFLKALPQLLILMAKIGFWFKRQGENSFLNDLEKIIDDSTKEAPTPEERRANMRRLADLSRKLRT